MRAARRDDDDRERSRAEATRRPPAIAAWDDETGEEMPVPLTAGSQAQLEGILRLAGGEGDEELDKLSKEHLGQEGLTGPARCAEAIAAWLHHLGCEEALRRFLRVLSESVQAAKGASRSLRKVLELAELDVMTPREMLRRLKIRSPRHGAGPECRGERARADVSEEARRRRGRRRSGGGRFGGRAIIVAAAEQNAAEQAPARLVLA